MIGHTADFLLNMSTKFEFGVFLSCDAMLARYMPSSCVCLCGVNVAFWWVSDRTRLQWALYS